MAKQPQTITTHALRPTLDALDQCLKLKTDAVFMHDKDKALVSVSHNQITRVRTFLVQLRDELERLGISFLIEDGKLVIAKGSHRFNLRVRERRRQVRTLRKKRSYESEPRYDLSYAWAGIIAVNDSTYTWGEWFETRRRRLEDSVPDISQRFKDKFDRAEERRLEWLEEEKESERRREIRRIHRARMELEDRRYEFLRDYSKRIKSIDKIIEMREKIKMMFSSTDDIHYRKIDKWLQSEIRRIKSQVSPKAVKALLSGSGLFDDVRL